MGFFVSQDSRTFRNDMKKGLAGPALFVSYAAYTFLVYIIAEHAAPVKCFLEKTSSLYHAKCTAPTRYDLTSKKIYTPLLDFWRKHGIV